MATSIVGSAPPTLLHLRCPTFMHRHVATATARGVLLSLSLPSGRYRRFRSTFVTSCSAATAERPPKAEKGASDKDKRITPKSVDFSRWYLDVVRDAELADYGPVRGTMVIRPYGYAIWEGVQSYLDSRFKELGVQNAYFPQLIPLSFLQKEADHVEGFAPELALVTKGGGKDLEEPLVVRPTSETMVNHMLAQWIQSYRDLPMLLNQWANVHRWELRTRPFIRTLEFLWQEGHTAHATAEEAKAMAEQMVNVYADFAINCAAMPVIPGRKSRIESFAGANVTLTIEAMMGDRRALQAGTSHDLGDNFARAFGTQFLDEAGELVHPQQTSWGASTRLIGGIIMTHGDDMGLRLPPGLAPIQVVIVPILKKNTDTEAVLAAADSLAEAAKAAGLRAKVDAGTEKTPGFKFSYWEMKGVPVRVEVGPRDVAQGTCVAARRDRPGKEGKQFGIPLEPAGFVASMRQLLDEVHEGLLSEATAFRDANIVDVQTYDDLKAAIEAGKWAKGRWAGSDEDEKRIKEETTATLRCIPFEQPGGSGPCFLTGADAAEVAIFAKAY
ncbi:g119 [Coccomyxa elongata]